ncbi:hypothetical protein CSUI_011468, partial [Cystoisospora suis]
VQRAILFNNEEAEERRSSDGNSHTTTTTLTGLDAKKKKTQTTWKVGIHASDFPPFLPGRLWQIKQRRQQERDSWRQEVG